MPSNKLDKKKLDHYKKLLFKLKEDFSHDINNMVNNPGGKETDFEENAGHVQHMADVATDMYDREFNLGLASNEREVLNKIGVALKKIGDKSFGLCQDCKKPIAAARLNAIPYVETCLKCQEKLEAQR